MAGTGVFSEIIEGDVYKYYADGEWKKSASKASVQIFNPATRKVQYKVQGESPALPGPFRCFWHAYPGLLSGCTVVAS